MGTPMSIKYRVWNRAKTEYFETFDRQLAYEVRKGSESNCYYGNGCLSREAVEFCEKYSSEEDCTIEEVIV